MVPLRHLARTSSSDDEPMAEARWRSCSSRWLRMERQDDLWSTCRRKHEPPATLSIPGAACCIPSRRSDGNGWTWTWLLAEEYFCEVDIKYLCRRQMFAGYAISCNRQALRGSGSCTFSPDDPRSLVLSPGTARGSRRCRETTADLLLEEGRLGGENENGDTYLPRLPSLLCMRRAHVDQRNTGHRPLSPHPISDEQSSIIHHRGGEGPG